MKRILSMIIAVIMAFGCFAFVCSAEEFKTSYNAANYTTVYVCTKSVIKSSDGSNDSADIYTFNEKGYLIKQKVKEQADDAYTYVYTVDSKGNVVLKPGKAVDYAYASTRTYDDKGNITKIVTKDYYSNETDTNTYTYNSKGNLIKETVKFGSGSFSYTYTYNSKGYITKCVYKSSVDDSKNITYSYSGGRLVKKVQKNSKGETSTQTYDYYSNGTLKKQTFKEPGNSYINTYDTKGNMTKEVLKNSDGSSSKVYTNTYDKNGNLTKQVCKGSVNSTTINTYNSKGWLTKSKTGKDYTTYTYDSKGNAIKCVEKAYDSSIDSYITTTITNTYKKITSKSPVIDGRIHVQYATCKYTGKAKTPNITIDGMNKGVDYKVTYSNNVKVGTASAKITFLGEYATQRPVTITYKITK